MSEAKTLADTLDCMADLCEDTSGREMRTFRDAAKLLREQEQQLSAATQRADDAERALREAREQEPVAYRVTWSNNDRQYYTRKPSGVPGLEPLYAAPVPPPAAAQTIDRYRFKNAPCYLCGYNGPGYFQPSSHPCAEQYHAAENANPNCTYPDCKCPFDMGADGKCLLWMQADAGKAVPDAGLLWSFLRNVMRQGEAIAKDYATDTGRDAYERHSARLDSAASKRADELIEILAASQSAGEGKV